MKNLECPSCQTPIGLFRFVFVTELKLNPWSLSCGKCKTKLKVGKHTELLFALKMLWVMILGWLFIHYVPDAYLLPGLILVVLANEVSSYYLHKMLGVGLKLRE